jgi:hypothetical protein
MKLHMFRTVPMSIIRSLFTVHSAMVYVIQVCRQLSSRTRMRSDKIMTLYVKEQVRKCTESVKIVVLSLWYCLCKILNLWMHISAAVTKYTSSVTTLFILFYSCYFFRLFWEAITSSSKVQKDISIFHRAFLSSIMDKTPTHALFTQHYISLAC